MIESYSILKKNGWLLVVGLTLGILVFFMGGMTEEEPNQVSTDKEVLNLGNPDSEEKHFVKESNTEKGNGGLDQPYRRIVPENNEKGWISFDAAVSPDERNYITLRVWGSEDTTGPLNLYADKTNIKLGNFWDFGVREQPFPGRWVYRTILLPREITESQTEVRLRLQAQSPAFAVYNVYTHTEPYFEIPAGEQQGPPFEWGAFREKPENYPSIEDRLLERAEKEIERVIETDVVGSGYWKGNHHALLGLKALAVIYHTEWCDYYQDEDIPRRVRDAIDAHAVRQAEYHGATGKMFYRGWTPHGQIARAYSLLHEQFEQNGWLEEPVTLRGEEGEQTISRRKLYADFFHEGFQWRRMDRRHYTNQPQYTSETLYYTQKALRKLGDERALTREQALWYVHEANGVEPLRTRPFGIDGDAGGLPYYVITPKGMGREEGYTHGYGDAFRRVLDWYRRTGSEKLREKAALGLKARCSYFRYPANDSDGYRTLEVFGTHGRGASYPGNNGRYYGINEAVMLETPTAKRQGELEVAHGRPYRLESDLDKKGAHWHPLNTIRAYEHYKKFKQLQPTDYRLAMEPEREDDGIVYGDEQVGAYAFRHGETRVYGIFYPNSLPLNKGILRYTQPDKDRLVDVRFETHYPSSGLFREVEHPWGTRKYELPPPPPGMSEWPEQARRHRLAYFYRLCYGDYLIGMNTTRKGTYREQTYQLEIPEGINRAVNVDTGEPVDLNGSIEVDPATTLVLYLEEE